MCGSLSPSLLSSASPSLPHSLRTTCKQETRRHQTQQKVTEALTDRRLLFLVLLLLPHHLPHEEAAPRLHPKGPAGRRAPSPRRGARGAAAGGAEEGGGAGLCVVVVVGGGGEMNKEGDEEREGGGRDGAASEVGAKHV
jgi:hypothetical protein